MLRSKICKHQSIDSVNRFQSVIAYIKIVAVKCCLLYTLKYSFLACSQTKPHAFSLLENTERICSSNKLLPINTTETISNTNTAKKSLRKSITLPQSYIYTLNFTKFVIRKPIFIGMYKFIFCFLSDHD